MKPIEPGCLALIVGGSPKDIGSQCTVLYWVEAGGSFDVGSERFKSSGAGWAIENYEIVGVWDEKFLRRIDGGEPESVESKEGREVTA